jgi:phosphomannomutase/phosphoglucomutase
MIEGPVTNRRISRRKVRQAIIAGSSVIVLIIVGAGGYWLQQSRARSQAREADEAAKAAAAEIARRVAAPFSALRTQLVELGANSEIIAAFESGDDSIRNQLAARHAGAFHAALKLRLIPLGPIEPDTSARPPLSFASLDMLKRVAESSAPASVEAHLFGTPGQHIVLAAPALDAAGQLRGLLHLSLDVALFQEVMRGLDTAGGGAELFQAVGGKKIVLGKAGELRADVTPVVVSVPDTRWNLDYRPASGFALGVARPGGSRPSWPMYAGAILVALLAMVLVTLRHGGSRSRAPEPVSGEVVYAGAVRAIMDGVHPGMEKLVPDLPNLGQRGPITPVSRGMQGDDITRIMSRAELAAGGGAGQAVPAAGAAPPKPAAAAAPAADVDAPSPSGQSPISPVIFRAYDIRGVVKDALTPEVVTRIGAAIGTEAAALEQAAVIVGRDGRTSSPELSDAVITGLRAAGRNVIDVGMVPTPVLYFATHELDTHSGVMVTGSHNGPAYNGLKIVLAGETLAEDGIQKLYRRIVNDDLISGQGTLENADVVAAYIRRISDDIPVALGGALRLVMDCGNGVAGAVAPQLLRALGHDVIELFCEVDGRFPNHHPDPGQPQNLQALIERVRSEQADLGLAFDGDGDRLGVVDATGRIVWPDQQLMLLARDVLKRNPGAPIVFDVKCSRHLGAVIEAAGGTPVMWRTGHSIIQRKMKECGAPLAGEMSGHIFFAERWYGFDDALYTAARLLEVLMAAKRRPEEMFGDLPAAVATPELIVSLPEESHAPFMEGLRGNLGAFGDARVIDIDGFRVEFDDGWGLVRPSNTTPALVVRFEADSDAALSRVKGVFRDVLLKTRSDLKLPF